MVSLIRTPFRSVPRDFCPFRLLIRWWCGMIWPEQKLPTKFFTSPALRFLLAATKASTVEVQKMPLPYLGTPSSWGGMGSILLGLGLECSPIMCAAWSNPMGVLLRLVLEDRGPFGGTDLRIKVSNISPRIAFSNYVRAPSKYFYQMVKDLDGVLCWPEPARRSSAECWVQCSKLKNTVNEIHCYFSM